MTQVLTVLMTARPFRTLLIFTIIVDMFSIGFVYVMTHIIYCYHSLTVP
jgi:hypothetical protein